MDEFWKCQIRCRETILDQIGFLNMNDFEILDLLLYWIPRKGFNFGFESWLAYV